MSTYKSGPVCISLVLKTFIVFCGYKKGPNTSCEIIILILFVLKYSECVAVVLHLSNVFRYANSFKYTGLCRTTLCSAANRNSILNHIGIFVFIQRAGSKFYCFYFSKQISSIFFWLFSYIWRCKCEGTGGYRK